MSTSFGAQPSGSISKSEFLSSLPRWRRWLSRFNWHPVVEYEIREIEFERRKIGFENRKIGFENRKIEHEKRMQELASEIEQIEKETEQLQKENARLAQINSMLERFEREHLSGSIPPPSTGGSCS